MQSSKQSATNEARLNALEEGISNNKYAINALRERYWVLNQKGIRSLDEYHLSLVSKNRLAQIIAKVFNSVELYTLSLDMNVDPELLSSDHIMRAIELIDYLHRRSLIPHLLRRLNALRPLEEWYEMDIISKENR